MVKGIVNASDAHARSYANSKCGQIVLTLLGTVEEKIEEACNEGKFGCMVKFTKKKFPYIDSTYVQDKLCEELKELGYDVLYSPKYRSLNISW